MVSFIRCPTGKGGMVIGVKLAIWFAADGALFLCGAGGGAAGVGGFLYDCAAICALLHMMFSVIGRFPSSAALMCAGDGRDGGRLLIMANAALSAFGSRFGGGRFLCDLPLAVGVSGFLYICFAIHASLPMTGLIRRPVGKGGMVTGIKLAIRFAADFAPFRFGAGGGAAGVSGFFYICVAIVASLPMPGLIKYPAGKGGVNIGVKLAVWFAADFALFLCVAGGSAAGVSSFLYNRTAICTLFHMMHSISGRFPSSAALMRAGDGRDGGRFFVVANAALSAFGSRFGGGRFLCDLPLAVGVGSFFYICAAS